MSYRRFNDADGRSWEAWEVHPSSVERRLTADRRSAPRDLADRPVRDDRTDRIDRHDRNDRGDRRRGTDFRLVIPRELRDGWLALQGKDERLRVSPIPEGWMALSDEELSSLVTRAGHHD